MALMYGYHAQSELDGADPFPFDAESALDAAKNFAKPADPCEILDFFKELEILSPQWAQRLNSPLFSQWESRHLRLFQYFVERYWLQAVSDYDLIGRVKFSIIACLTVKFLGGDLLQTAQRFAKEIENDPDNVDAILDGAYCAPAFTDEKLLGLLLEDEL